jgi:hypothetical protein
MCEPRPTLRSPDSPPSTSFSTQLLGNLVRVQAGPHGSLLFKAPDGDVFVRDDQPNLPLVRLPSHPATEPAQLNEMRFVLDVLRGSVAMNHDGFVEQLDYAKKPQSLAQERGAPRSY